MKDGRPFEVFDVAPQKVLNEASVLLRVLQPEMVDFELQQSYTFQVTTQSLASSALVGKALTHLPILILISGWTK